MGQKMGPDRGKKVTSNKFLIVNWRVNANSSFRQQFLKDGMLVIFFSWFQFLIWISTHSALVTKMKRKKMQPKSKAQTAKVFRDFCESTTLHGYSYLYIATSILMKIITFSSKMEVYVCSSSVCKCFWGSSSVSSAA